MSADNSSRSPARATKSKHTNMILPSPAAPPQSYPVLKSIENFMESMASVFQHASIISFSTLGANDEYERSSQLAYRRDAICS